MVNIANWLESNRFGTHLTIEKAETVHLSTDEMLRSKRELMICMNEHLQHFVSYCKYLSVLGGGVLTRT